MNPASANQGVSTETFADTLGQVREGMRRLAVLLEEEAQAIEAKDLQGLQHRLDATRPLVADLESRIAALRAAVERNGFAFTTEGIERFIEAQDPGDRTLDQWSELLEEARYCERLNRELGRLIERQQRRIALGLSLLLGEAAEATTYDPRGRPVGSGQTGRTLDQA